MRTFVVLLAALALGAAGCGKSDKPNNSNIQTPDNQPIGMPKPPDGGAKPVKGGISVQGGAEKGAGKALPPVPPLVVKP